MFNNAMFIGFKLYSRWVPPDYLKLPGRDIP